MIWLEIPLLTGLKSGFPKILLVKNVLSLQNPETNFPKNAPKYLKLQPLNWKPKISLAF